MLDALGLLVLFGGLGLLIATPAIPAFLVIGGILLAWGSEGDQRRVGLAAVLTGAGLVAAAFLAVGTTAI